MHLSELILELKKRRETLNVTQEQLAEIAGVGLRTLKQFESGKDTYPSNSYEFLECVLVIH